ncbi:chymotrypsin-1-like [Vespa velutina]|uniref:chymotrypsin-1-like n=1 Tax=Vespa velutina TaxID=202808 RepID=UPI001FB4BEC7|nr:chymotrypsin-1-like [Vespa velutina]
MDRFRMSYLALFVLGVLAREACAEAPERIVGGSRAAIGEFPYQVSLRVNGNHICGGSIISSRHVVTAAHCVNNWVNIPNPYYTIVTGTIYLGNSGQTHNIASVTVHPRYIGTSQTSWINDVAVLALEEPINFNIYQKPIPLLETEIPDNSLLHLSGWGKIYANGPISNVLLKANMYSTNNNVCQKQHSLTIYQSHICALNHKGIGACQGDSGGPLTYDGQLAGIVSWVIPCAVGVPDVFTKVSSHVAFIRNAMLN